jgi:hypothetical protein
VRPPSLLVIRLHICTAVALSPSVIKFEPVRDGRTSEDDTRLGIYHEARQKGQLATLVVGR